MKMKQIGGLILALFSLLLASQAETPSPEKLLPADTLGFFTIPDYAKACASFAGSPSRQAWDDPSLKPFKDKFVAKFKSDILGPLEQAFGVKFADYTELLQGQLTMAITQNGWDGSSGTDPGFLFILDTKDKSAALGTQLAELKKKWVEAGREIQTEKIRGQDFMRLIYFSDEFSKAMKKAFPAPNEGAEPKEDGQSKKAPKKEQLIIGQSESLLILGSLAADIEKVLVHQGGGEMPSLADQGAFSARREALFGNSLAYGWLNLKTFVGILAKAPAPAETPGQANPLSPDKLVSAMGLNALETLSLVVQNSQEGVLINAELQAPEASRRGLLKIFSFEHKSAKPPPFVPADALKFNRYRLDLQKSFAGFETMLGQISEQYASLFKTMVDLAGKDKDDKFDLRQQLIGNLGDDIISYEKAPRSLTLEDLNEPPTIYLISSPRPEQLVSALKAVVSFLPPGLSAPKSKERDFLGRKIFTLTFSSTSREGKRTDRSLHYSASGGYVALSFDVGMIEEYLRGAPAKSLAGQAGLAEAAQKVGGMETGLFVYENQRETTRIALETLKKESGTLASLLEGSALAGRLGVSESAKLKDWLDFSLLPPFDKIAKYFYITVCTGNVNADGMSFKFFTPVPPGFSGN